MPRPLTTEEYLSVSIATRGESRTHRVWPREALRSFAEADVAAPHGATGATVGQERRIARAWRAVVFSAASVFQPSVRRKSAPE